VPRKRRRKSAFLGVSDLAFGGLATGNIQNDIDYIPIEDYRRCGRFYTKGFQGAEVGDGSQRK
jgi:hypothetical protein